MLLVVVFSMVTDEGAFMADQDQNDKALRALFPTFMLEADFPGFQQEKDALLRRVYAIRDEDEAGRVQSC